MTSTDRSSSNATSPSEDAGGDVARFTLAERLVHRTTAVLMSICLVTAFILYNGSVSIAVGHRHVIELVHVYCGFALPVPMVLGLVSVAYRVDLRRLGRFSRADRAWLRSSTRRSGTIKVGKFNAGQKVNSWLVCGAILVLLGTGVLMYFVNLSPLSWRTGATFVHDWVSLAIGLLIAGHVTYAVKDPQARRGMRTGWVSRRWARAEHTSWLASLESESVESEGLESENPESVERPDQTLPSAE